MVYSFTRKSRPTGEFYNFAQTEWPALEAEDQPPDTLTCTPSRNTEEEKTLNIFQRVTCKNACHQLVCTSKNCYIIKIAGLKATYTTFFVNYGFCSCWWVVCLFFSSLWSLILYCTSSAVQNEVCFPSCPCAHCLTANADAVRIRLWTHQFILVQVAERIFHYDISSANHTDIWSTRLYQEVAFW